MDEDNAGQADSQANQVDVEKEAKQMGWVPKEDFRGDQERWVDAQTFYDRGQQVLPIIKKDRERLSAEVQAVRGELTTTQQLLSGALDSLTEFKKYHDETAKREYERALSKLKSDKKAALKEGDTDAVVEIDDAIATLREESAAPAAPQPEKPPTKIDYTQTPWFQDWYRDNSVWYGKDAERTDYAHMVTPGIRQQHPNLTGKEFLDKVTTEVEKRFTAPRRNGADRVEGSRGGATQSGRNGKSYDDLPAEAKVACDKFAGKLVGTGKAYKTEKEWRSKYTNDYFGAENQ